MLRSGFIYLNPVAVGVLKIDLPNTIGTCGYRVPDSFGVVMGNVVAAEVTQKGIKIRKLKSEVNANVGFYAMVISFHNVKFAAIPERKPADVGLSGSVFDLLKPQDISVKFGAELKVLNGNGSVIERQFLHKGRLSKISA
jgi:hypothetical protein